ncbi:MAG: hypothetical protein LBV38_05705 [Alistipes sp.]|jgi:hypothetical protein|nr:hypothetical protein [Alistipes sp.]
MKYAIYTFVLLFLIGCDKNPDVNANEPQQSYGKHYVYVDNQLDEEFEITGPTSKSQHVLPDSVTINNFHRVVIPPNQTVLFRVYVGLEGKEALNFFDYQSVLTNDFWGSYVSLVRWSSTVSGDLWLKKYWNYEQTDRWNATYTLTISEESVYGLMH